MEPIGRAGRLAEVGIAIAILLLAFWLGTWTALKEYRAEMRGGAIILCLVAVVHLALLWIDKDLFQRRRLVLIALFVGGVGGLLSAKWLEPDRKTILYVSPVPQLSRQPFYGEFVDELLRQAKQGGLDVAVWLPNRDFDPQNQEELLLAALKEKKRYSAVIFSPFIINSEDEDTLLDFLIKSQDLNLILFDIDISDSVQQRLTNVGLGIPACVKGDELEGGRLAAQATLDYSYSRKLMNPKVVVFDRQLGESQRAHEYQQRLAQGNNGVKPTITRWLSTRYSRDEGFENALRELSGGEKQIDVIFATNDVSALGVRDAVIQLRNRKPPLATRDLKIIGYDGIDEVNSLLQNPNEDLLLNSVDVRLPDQVGGIMWLVNQLVSDKQKVPHFRGRPCIQKQPRLLRAAPPTGPG